MGQKRILKILNKCRKDLRRIIGAIIGHCKLNTHLHRMGLNQRTTCRRCNEEDETPLQLLLECPALIGKRCAIIKHHTLMADDIINAKLLAQLYCLTVTEKLYNFWTNK